MTVRPSFIGVIFAVSVGFASLQGAAQSRQAADTFARKVVEIHDHGAQPKRRARRTTLTETELNSWFTYRAQPLLPPGLTQPKVTIVGAGKLLGTATVDLQAIGKSRSTGGTFDVWSLLGGKLPISITGVLHSKGGQGRFELHGVDVSGVPFPKPLLEELVAYYTRTEDHPKGYRLDDPFALPANIEHIEIGQGQAIVVQ